MPAEVRRWEEVVRSFGAAVLRGYCTWDQPYALLAIPATIQDISHAPGMTNLRKCETNVVPLVLRQALLALPFLAQVIEN